jgi:hypothetical protein
VTLPEIPTQTNPAAVAHAPTTPPPAQLAALKKEHPKLQLKPAPSQIVQTTDDPKPLHVEIKEAAAFAALNILNASQIASLEREVGDIARNKDAVIQGIKNDSLSNSVESLQLISQKMHQLGIKNEAMQEIMSYLPHNGPVVSSIDRSGRTA